MRFMSELWILFPPIILGVLLPALGSFLTCTHLYSIEYSIDTKKTLSAELWSYFSMQFFSLQYYNLPTLVYLNSSDSQLLFFNSRLFLPTLQPGNFLQALSCGYSIVYFICLHLTGNKRPSLPDMQCLESHCFINFIYFSSYFRQKDKLNSNYSSWPEANVQCLFKKA